MQNSNLVWIQLVWKPDNSVIGHFYMRGIPRKDDIVIVNQGEAAGIVTDIMWSIGTKDIISVFLDPDPYKKD